LLDKVQNELDDLLEQRCMISCADDYETLSLIEEEAGVHKAKVQKTEKKKASAAVLPPHKTI